MGWMAVGVLLLVLWALGALVFKVASVLVHLLLFAALVALGVYLVQRVKAHRSTA